MKCNLCSDSPDDPEQLIRTDSEEGLRLNVQQIISKHFELELRLSNTNSYICRSCCKIVCDFHELYLKVERTQILTSQEILNQKDLAYEPLAALQNELKAEFGEIRLEPEHHSWTVPPELHDATKRCSTGLVAQPQFEDKSLIDIEVNIKREEMIHVDDLNEVSNHYNEPFVETETDEIGQAIDNLINDELNVISSSPLNEQKGEIEGIKLEPENNSWTVAPELIDATKKSSTRIVARSQCQDKSLIDIEDNIKREKNTHYEDLNEEGNLENEPFVESAADEIGQAVDNLMDVYEINEIFFPPLKKHPSKKTQVSKGYDKFLAENFKISCCLCQNSLPDFKALESHFRKQHNTRGYVLCCGKQISRRGALVDHIRMHKDPESFKCPTCGKVVSNSESLGKHMRLHEYEGRRPFQCKLCPKSYLQRCNLAKHIQQKHAPKCEKNINCPQCEKV